MISSHHVDVMTDSGQSHFIVVEKVGSGTIRCSKKWVSNEGKVNASMVGAVE